MEKIKLKNGQEFELIPMGIEERENLRVFKIISTLTQEELITLFSSENIEIVLYILADGTTGKTYLDCVDLKGIALTLDYQINDSTVNDIYSVIVNTDKTGKALQGIEEDITDLSNIVVMSTMMM